MERAKAFSRRIKSGESSKGCYAFKVEERGVPNDERIRKEEK
jgi:hypothetical protein